MHTHLIEREREKRLWVRDRGRERERERDKYIDRQIWHIYVHIYIYTYIYSTYTVTVLWLHFLLVLIMYMYFYPETLTMNSKTLHIRYTATAVFIHFHSLGFLAPFLFEQYWFKLTDISNWRYSIVQNWSMAVSTCSITVKGYPLPTPLSLESYCSIIWIFSLICQFEIWTCTKVWRSYTHLPLLSYSVCKAWIPSTWKSVLQTAQVCEGRVKDVWKVCVEGKKTPPLIRANRAPVTPPMGVGKQPITELDLMPFFLCNFAIWQHQ